MIHYEGSWFPNFPRFNLATAFAKLIDMLMALARMRSQENIDYCLCDSLTCGLIYDSNLMGM